MKRTVFLVLLASACNTTDVPSQQRVVVTDSAGVSIFAVAPATDAPLISASAPTPIVSIGTADGEAWSLFSGIAGACRFTGGNLLVADGASREVRVFGARGAYLKTYGRQGSGPNEFAALSGLWCAPDQAFVYDWTTRRLTFLDANASPAGVVTLESAATVSALVPVGRLTDGRLVTRGSGPPADAGTSPGVRETQLGLILHRADGSVMDRVTTSVDLEQIFLPTTDGQGIRIRGVPFGRTTQVVLLGDRIAIGTQREPEIRILEPSGRVHAIIRINVPARTASTVEIEHELTTSPRFRNVTPQLVGPRPLPFYGQLATDRQGRLWIQDFHVDAARRTTWTVVDIGTRSAIRVRLPAALRILSITEDAIVGVATDEDGVEQVRVYPMTR